MDLNQIRQQYPQYADISDEILAEGLRKKFYPDMDPQDFGQRIGLLKHPIKTTETDPSKMEYPDTIGRGRQEAVANIISGGAASIASGLAGIATGGNADVVNKVQSSMTYEPKTIPGKEDVKEITAPFTFLAKGADYVGGKVTDITGSPAAGAAVNTAIQAVPMVLGGKGLKPEGRVEVLDKTQEAVAKFQKEGLVFPPNQARPNLFNSLLEGAGGKIKTQQMASIKNAEGLDNFVRKGLGVKPDTPLDTNLLSSIRSEAGKDYEAIKKVPGKITPGTSYFQSLNAVAKKYIGAAKDFNVKSPVVDLVNEVKKIKSFGADSAIEYIKVLREESDKAFRTGDKALGQAYRQVSGAIEDAIDKHLVNGKYPKSVIDNYRGARQRIAQTYTVQKALNQATGHVDARVLARELAKDKPLTGPIRSAAEFGAAFPKLAQPPSMVGSVTPYSPIDVGAATIASSVTGDIKGAAIIGARAPVRSMLLSKAYQKTLGKAPSENTLKKLSESRKRAKKLAAGAAADSQQDNGPP